MLYTGKGDQGTTKLFDCPPGVRVKKTELIFDALGTVDELNAHTGFAKSLASAGGYKVDLEDKHLDYVDILNRVQNNLFSLQAHLAGADIHIGIEEIEFLEKIINQIESTLPPITSFLIPGGSNTAAYLDVCRTVTRRAERMLLRVYDAAVRESNEHYLKFLNRLSSLFYALERLANHHDNFKEAAPTYQ